MIPAVVGAVSASDFPPQIVQVTSTQTVVIPSGATKVDIFAMSGGQAGSPPTSYNAGNGGQGGTLSYALDQSIGASVTGQLYCSIGAAQTPGGGGFPGNDTEVRWDSSSGTSVVLASGGGSFAGSSPIPHSGGAGGFGDAVSAAKGSTSPGGGGGGPGGSDSVGSAGGNGVFVDGHAGYAGGYGDMTTMQARLGISWASMGGYGSYGNGVSGDTPGGGGGGGGSDGAFFGTSGNGARGEVYLRFHI